MFPPQLQRMFDAQTALIAGQTNDPKFEQLVSKLMERCSMSRESVIKGIVALAEGRLS